MHPMKAGAHSFVTLRSRGILGIGLSLTDPEVFLAGPTHQGDEDLL